MTQIEEPEIVYYTQDEVTEITKAEYERGYSMGCEDIKFMFNLESGRKYFDPDASITDTYIVNKNTVDEIEIQQNEFVISMNQYSYGDKNTITFGRNAIKNVIRALSRLIDIE